jgi:hypothetical protein
MLNDICAKIRSRIHEKVLERWRMTGRAHPKTGKDPEFYADIDKEEDEFVDNLMEMMKQHGLGI